MAWLAFPTVLLLKVKFVEILTAPNDFIKPPANLPTSVVVVLVLRHVARLMQDAHVLFQSPKASD